MSKKPILRRSWDYTVRAPFGLWRRTPSRDAQYYVSRVRGFSIVETSRILGCLVLLTVGVLAGGYGYSAAAQEPEGLRIDKFTFMDFPAGLELEAADYVLMRHIGGELYEWFEYHLDGTDGGTHVAIYLTQPSMKPLSAQEALEIFGTGDSPPQSARLQTRLFDSELFQSVDAPILSDLSEDRASSILDWLSLASMEVVAVDDTFRVQVPVKRIEHPGGCIECINGSDGRRRVDNTLAWPFQTIGRVRNEWSASGTGFLISPRVALTNAHVVVNTTTGEVSSPGLTTFAPGQTYHPLVSKSEYPFGSQPAHTIHVPQAYLDALAQHGADSWEAAIHDYAIIDFGPSDGVPFPGINTFMTLNGSPNPTFPLKAGYACWAGGERRHGDMWWDHGPIVTNLKPSLQTIDPLILFTLIDAASGMSGSPVVETGGPTGHQIVGIHSACAQVNGEDASIGPEFSYRNFAFFAEALGLQLQDDNREPNNEPTAPVTVRLGEEGGTISNLIQLNEDWYVLEFEQDGSDAPSDNKDWSVTVSWEVKRDYSIRSIGDPEAIGDIDLQLFDDQGRVLDTGRRSLDGVSPRRREVVRAQDYSGAYMLLRVYGDNAGAVYSINVRPGFTDCEELPNPQGVQASYKSYRSQMDVLWSPVDGATAYHVYRGRTSNPFDATRIGMAFDNFYQDDLPARANIVSSSAIVLPPGMWSVAIGVIVLLVRRSGRTKAIWPWARLKQDRVFGRIHTRHNRLGFQFAVLAACILFAGFAGCRDLPPTTGDDTYWYWVKSVNECGGESEGFGTGAIGKVTPPAGRHSSKGVAIVGNGRLESETQSS